jgi:hypothetical protein
MIREVRPDPFIFRNRVSDAGYEWGKREDGQSCLMMRDAPGVGLHTKELHPGLFREFAGLEPTREAIQGFAEEYGDLFNHWQGSRSEDGALIWGSLFSTWKEKIAEMRILVSLWDQIQTRQIAALKKVITQTDEGPWYTIRLPRRRVLASLAYENTPSSPNELVRFYPIQFAPNDVVLPARCALQIEINNRLSEHSTIAVLSWTPDTNEATGGYHQRINLKPLNLLAAIWTQFAQAVTGEFQLRQCFCGNYFPVGPGGRRADATTCDDTCRVKRWVNRKKQERITSKRNPRRSAR